MLINFVCLGNICRSPMAEFVARDYVKKHQLNQFIITSSGTSGYHDGEDMHHGTKKLLTQKQIPCQGFISKRIDKELFDKSKYVVVMDNSNFANVTKMFGSNKKILKICDFGNLGYGEVPDPWYTDNFEETYMILNDAIKNLFEWILKDAK